MTLISLLIRDEESTDYQLISDVTVAAFESMEISDHNEQFIIEALREAKALTVGEALPDAVATLVSAPKRSARR